MAQYDALLSAFMSPDNSIRRQAEAAWDGLKERVPDEVLEQTCLVLGRRGPGSEGLRAMAAVLLRTLFDIRSNIWLRVQPATKTGVKAALLNRLTEEPVAHVRRKLTHAVGQLAGVSAAEAEWPELMALTVSLCSTTQPSADMKVVGLDLINTISEFCPELLVPHRVGLLQMFDACLEDAQLGVKVAGLQACCSFLQDVNTGSCMVAGSSIAQKMIRVLEATVNAKDESAAREVLEALNVVAAKQPGVFVEGGTFGLVGNAMVSLAATPALEVATRELALECITCIVENAPSAAQDEGISVTQAMISVTISLLVQNGGDEGRDLLEWLSKTDGDDDEDEDDDDELGKIAAGSLNRVAIALDGQVVLSSALPICSELLGDTSDWHRRKAGLLTLLLIGEGCGTELAASGLLPQIVLGSVASGIGDEHPRVRHAALGCVAQMADDYSSWESGGAGNAEGEGDDEDEEPSGGSFQSAFHAQILPLLVRSLAGPNANMPRIQAAAVGALITFCNPEHMQAEWLYMPSPADLGEGGAIGQALLQSLSELVRGSTSLVVREEAMTAAGIVAQVLGPGFGSFYSAFMPLAREILVSTSPVQGAPAHAANSESLPDVDTFRGKTMEAIALMGGAVGADVFRADAHEVIRMLIYEQKSVNRDPSNPQSSYTLNTLARMAGVLGDEFLPYLTDAVTPLIEALSADAGIKVASVSNVATAKEEMEDAGLTPLEMDVRGLGRQVFGVNTSLMQAKESACRTLYQYTEDVGDAFAPHAARTLTVVLPNLGSRNAVAVQVVSAAIVPRLVGMASRRAAASGVASMAAEAQAMLDASIEALCEVTSRIDGNDESSKKGHEMEPSCIAADSLSTLFEEHCHYNKPSPLNISTEKETAAVVVLRDAAAASMRRSGSRSNADVGAGAGHPALAGLTGAVDAAEAEEQAEWEEDLLTSSVDGIGWLIKGGRERFLPTFETLLKPFILQLLRSDDETPLDAAATGAIPLSPSQRSYGLCMCIDVFEHCGDSGRRSVFRALLPALLRGCTDSVASTRQACAYGLGVAADFGGAEFDSSAPEALRLLMGLVEQGRAAEDDEDIAPVTDNAVSAAFRVIFARLGPIVASLGGGSIAGEGTECTRQLTPTVKTLLGMLPLKADIMEGHDCHRRIVDLAWARHHLLVGWGEGRHMPELLRALSGIMVYQPSDEEKAIASPGSQGYCRDAQCREACGITETEEDFWERQFVDRDTREQLEEAVTTLRTAFPHAFEEGWTALEDEERRALSTPTSSLLPRPR